MSLEAHILDTNFHGNSGSYYGSSLYNFSISPGWQKKDKKQPQRTYSKRKSPKTAWTISQIDDFLDSHLHHYQTVIIEKYNSAFFRKIFAQDEISSLVVKIFLLQAIVKEMGGFVSKKLFTYERFPEKIIFSCSHEAYDVLECAKENLF
jgi:hypothetical protein